jgi:hypothetical protein
MAAVVAEIEEPTERIEAEVCTLAGQIAAATCRFVLLVAELDRRGAWREWGCRSMAHWLSWRCALGIVAAREHVRVGCALENLPRVTDEFARGRLSYSKVRALIRVATPATEAKIIDFALVATASQLARTVRTYEHTRGDVQREQARLEVRRLRFFFEDEGTVLLEGRLTREQAELIREALDKALADVPVDQDASAEARRADALESVARAFLAGRSERVPTEVVVHVDADEVNEEDLSPFVARMLCDTGVRIDVRQGDAHRVGRRKRTIPVALRRAIEHRDHGMCRFPGCPNRAFVQVHHVAHYIRGGATNSKNCVLLCTFHHRLTHEGGWRALGDADGSLTFESATGRRCAEASTSGRDAPPWVPAPGIDESTIATSWGERLDLDLAVTAMYSWFPDEHASAEAWRAPPI